MKKKIPANYDEVDLRPILNILWNDRIKILLIATVSLLIGFGYLYLAPKKYLHTLSIEKNDYSLFENFIKTLDFEDFDTNRKDKTIMQKTYVMNKFINELKDYKEFMFVLKDTKNFRENFAKYTKLLEIKKIDDSKIILNLKWFDSQEIKDILKDTINLTIDNLEKSIIKDLDNIKEQENIVLRNKELKKLEYLKDQIWIAKELNISDNQITTFISKYDIPYYLIGYKAISKEIELIEKNFVRNRNRSVLEKNINLLKESSDLRIFNIYPSSEVKLLKDTKLILMISVLLGLIIGILYVSISKLSEFKLIFKNKY